MIILRADNRPLLSATKSASLLENYASGVSTITVNNLKPFYVGDPILIGEIGQFDAEILKVRAIDEATNTITLGDSDNDPAVTEYSHPESTKVTMIQFDQIRFFWTAATGTIADETPTFSESTPLTGWTSLDPTSWYSTHTDVTRDTGFGWFMYKNALSDEVSQNSNAIPYVGFTGNTAQQVFLDFESLLNTNELKLISINDKYSWLNEGLAIVKNKLNLTNCEYTVSTPQLVTIIPGTAEYQLAADFADVSEIVDGTSKTPIEFIPVSQVQSYIGENPSVTKYYIRGRYLGFAPTPTIAGTVYYTYRALSTKVSSLSTYINLPDNGFYILKNWMAFRAFSKFQNQQSAALYKAEWQESLNLLIQSSIKRNANLDTWGILSSANN